MIGSLNTCAHGRIWIAFYHFLRSSSLGIRTLLRTSDSNRIFGCFTLSSAGTWIRTKNFLLDITSATKNFPLQSSHIVEIGISPIRNRINVNSSTRRSCRGAVCISFRFHLPTFKCNTCKVIGGFEIF